MFRQHAAARAPKLFLLPPKWLQSNGSYISVRLDEGVVRGHHVEPRKNVTRTGTDWWSGFPAEG